MALPVPTECGAAALTHSFEATYYPSPTELAAIEQLQADSFAAELAQVDALVAARPELHQPMRLVVGNDGLAAAVARRLAQLGVDDIEVKVAAPISKHDGSEPLYYKNSQVGNYWPAEMVAAKKVAWDAQQPRHSSAYTKSQSSPKARKAARKRAKAGRKASR